MRQAEGKRTSKGHLLDAFAFASDGKDVVTHHHAWIPQTDHSPTTLHINAQIIQRIGILSLILLMLLPGILFAQQGRSESDFVYAKKLHKDGLYDLAAEALENYIAAYPESPHRVEASFLLGEALFADEQYENARSAFQLLHARFPDHPRAREALFRVADCYAELGDRDMQARALRRITIFYPSAKETPNALRTIGRIYVEDGRWADAEPPLQQIINQHEDYPRMLEVRLLWARVLAGRDEMENAVAEVNFIAENAQDPAIVAEALAWQARWLSELADTEGAEKAWRELVKKYPNSDYAGEAYTAIAFRFLQREQLAEADSLFRKALKAASNPSAVDAIQTALGDIRFLQGEYSEALKEYKEVSDPKSPPVLFRRAVTLEMLKRDREALHAYVGVSEEEEAADSLRWAALWRMAQLRQDPRLDLELEKIHPDSLVRAEALYLALYNFGAVDPQQTVVLAESLLVRYPWSPKVDDAALLRAGALTILGRLEEAKQAYTSFPDAFPYSPYAPFAAGRADYLTQHVLQTDAPHLALADLLARVAGDYDQHEFTLDLAQVYLDEFKDYDRAERELRKLLNDPNCPNTIEDRAAVMLARAIVSRWNKWKATRMEVVTGDDTTAGVREMAAKVAGELEPVMKKLPASGGAKTQYEFELITLRALAMPDKERTEYRRRAWSDYLDARPQPWNPSEVYLALAQAYARRIPSDTTSMADVANLYLETLLERWPRSVAAVQGLMVRGKVAQTRGNDELAVQSWTEAASRAKGPDRIEAWEKLIREDGVPMERRLELMEKVQREAYYHPLAGELDLLEAELLIRAGKYKEGAWTLMTAQTDLAPGNPGLLILGKPTGDRDYQLALAYEGQGLTDQAETYYRRYLTRNPRGLHVDEARLNLASLLLNRGRYDQALDLYARMLGEDSELGPRIRANRQAANIHFLQGDYDRARELALQTAKLDTNADSSFAFDQLAVVCLYRSGQSTRTQDEIKSLERRYKGRSDWDDAVARFWLERGRWYSRLKSWPEAQRAYERVIEKHARSKWTPYARYEMGRDFLTRNLFEEGLDVLTAMPDRYPDHSVLGQVYLTLGNYFVENGNITDGIAAYERVLADEVSRPLWPTVLKNQMQAYKSAGFYAGALKAAQTYMELFPNAEDKFEIRMQMGQYLVGTEQHEAAVELYEELILYANVENEAACQFFIGEALEKQGRYAEAVIEYLKVKYLGKPTKLQWAITALYNAGRCCERLDQPERAMELYRQIVVKEGLGSPFGRKAQEQVDRLQAQLEERED